MKDMTEGYDMVDTKNDVNTNLTSHGENITDEINTIQNIKNLVNTNSTNDDTDHRTEEILEDMNIEIKETNITDEPETKNEPNNVDIKKMNLMIMISQIPR